jgi:hypothetical protein
MAFIGNGAQLTDLDAGDIATGTVATARLATGTANSSTYLRGDSTWAEIASTPASLASTFPLKTGASLAAGRVVNVNSSGEVGDYPVVNTLGTLVTNTGGYGYSQFSTDGSRALYTTATNSPDGNYTLIIRGFGVTGSVSTTGTVTVTSNYNLRSGNGGGIESASYSTIPINETQFLVNFWVNGYTIIGECGFNRIRARAFVVTVDSSGNCTKGSDNNYTSQDNQTGAVSNGMYRFVNGLYGVYHVYRNSSYVYQYLGYYLSVAGDTVTVTQDNDFSNYTGTTEAGATFGQVTSSNIAVNTGSTNSNTLYKATWNGSALGTVTSETIQSNATRIVARLVSPTLLLAAYTDASNVLRAATYTINQSTGALTFFASRILDNTFAVGAVRLSLASESSTKYLLTAYNSGAQYGYSFEIDSSGNILGTGIKLTTGLTSEDLNPTYTGSSSTYRIANYGTQTQNFVVNSYNTPAWNSLGVSETVQNTSPATIVTDGVVGGFTGLTPGLTYFVDQTTYNGAVTTTPGNFVVGLATSSTQISLGL